MHLWTEVRAAPDHLPLPLTFFPANQVTRFVYVNPAFSAHMSGTLHIAPLQSALHLFDSVLNRAKEIGRCLSMHPSPPQPVSTETTLLHITRLQF
jgi:hypothetical protein